jgi:3-oxoacyl-[acyl-carrier protein] reductase
MNISFNGKQIFITGGSRGIGKTIAEQFCISGGKVIAPTHGELDLNDVSSINNYMVANKFEPSIIIFNAAINNKLSLENISEKDLIETFQINLFSSIQILKHFLPNMKKERRGKIIFISSLYAIVSKENRVLYSSSKNSVTGLMKTLSLELADFNILVNAVAPGYVMTDMTRKNLSSGEISEILNLIPTKKFQTEAEIANLVMFLASEYNQNITGQLIAVDGGFLCR